MSAAPVYTLCLLAALSLSTALAQDDGYETFPAYNASRYKLPPFHLDWAGALGACQSDGGGSLLVVINSLEEAEVVKELMLRIVDTALQDAWVGINDIATEGQWVTVQGGLLSASGYNEWAPGEPSQGTSANCGLVWADARYYDDPCDRVWPFICEKPNV